MSSEAVHDCMYSVSEWYSVERAEIHVFLPWVFVIYSVHVDLEKECH